MRITLAATAVLAALLAPAPVLAQANVQNIVAVGDSLAAGYSNGSLVVHHQRTSVPALVARQAGQADFQQPTISDPGLPPELQLLNLTPVFARKPGAGAPTNLALTRPYNNLAVPGATSVDALTRRADAGGLHDVILRGLGTQVEQAVAQRPSLVLLWIGNNDVLGAAIAGRAVPGQTLVPTDVFRQTYGAIVTALAASGARIVTATLPDVTTIPFVTTIRPVVTDPATGRPVLLNGQNIPLVGPTGPLASNSLVTLNAAPLLAQGIGIPAALGGTGAALPDEVILDANEVAIIRDHVSANNRAIVEIATASSIPVVDVHGLLQELSTVGREIGGVRLTSAFLTGGVFSYDGVHPTDLGYAVLANEWIATINSGLGNDIPPVDLRPFFGFSETGGVRMTAAPGTSLVPVFDVEALVGWQRQLFPGQR